MLLSLDTQGIVFNGGYDFLRLEVPFSYYPDKKNKFEGIFVLERTIDTEDKWVEWTEYSEEIDSDFEDGVIDKITSYLKDFKFYHSLLNLDLKIEDEV